MYPRGKGAKFVVETVVGLSLQQRPQVMCQHWAGGSVFGRGPDAPFFPLLAKCLSSFNEFDEGGSTSRAPPAVVKDEMLVAVLVASFSFTNLRAPLRAVISISDASEDGGASGEASTFLSSHVGKPTVR